MAILLCRIWNLLVFSGRGGRFNRSPMKSADQLDKELEEYMAESRNQIDDMLMWTSLSFLFLSMSECYFFSFLLLMQRYFFMFYAVLELFWRNFLRTCFAVRNFKFGLPFWGRCVSILLLLGMAWISISFWGFQWRKSMIFEEKWQQDVNSCLRSVTWRIENTRSKSSIINYGSFVQRRVEISNGVFSPKILHRLQRQKLFWNC